MLRFIWFLFDTRQNICRTPILIKLFSANNEKYYCIVCFPETIVVTWSKGFLCPAIHDYILSKWNGKSSWVYSNIYIFYILEKSKIKTEASTKGMCTTIVFTYRKYCLLFLQWNTESVSWRRLKRKDDDDAEILLFPPIMTVI